MEGDGDNDKIPEIKYHRRLDRSPEKVLKLMNEYDKKLISEFRRAKENARHKLVDLQDEIDDRCVFIGCQWHVAAHKGYKCNQTTVIQNSLSVLYLMYIKSPGLLYA